MDQLPQHILEEIFLFVPKNYNLRLVCKTFKNIIDYSAKLMKNKWHIVDDAESDHLNTINYHYQNLIIHELNFENFCWLSNYKHKNLVKAIEFRCAEVEVKESPLFVQYILFNFNLLETIRFDPHDIVYRQDSNFYVKVIPNQLSNLETLDIVSYENHHYNVRS